MFNMDESSQENLKAIHVEAYNGYLLSILEWVRNLKSDKIQTTKYSLERLDFVNFFLFLANDIFFLTNKNIEYY